jgi:hypothetical protein
VQTFHQKEREKSAATAAQCSRSQVGANGEVLDALGNPLNLLSYIFSVGKVFRAQPDFSSSILVPGTLQPAISKIHFHYLT